MKFQVLYHGENTWQDVGEERMRRILANNYTDVELCMEDLANGYTVYTVTSAYRQVKEDEAE